MREAVRWHGALTWPAFCEWPLEEQVGLLAHYRTMQQLDGIRAWDAEVQREAARKRNGIRGKRPRR